VGAATVALASFPSQAQISNDVVKIGVLTDMNGVFSDAVGAGSVLAAKMAVEDFGGSVLGKPIEVVSADHQNKADVGAAVARQWFDADKVDAIFDLNTSSVALAVQQIGRDKKRLTFMSGAGSSDITGKFCTPYTVLCLRSCLGERYDTVDHEERWQGAGFCSVTT